MPPTNKDRVSDSYNPANLHQSHQTILAVGAKKGNALSVTQPATRLVKAAAFVMRHDLGMAMTQGSGKAG